MWHFAECAIQGRGHLKTDVPCQDKTIVLNKNDVYVTALADGAGSAKYSHFGAENIVNTVANILATNFDNYFSHENANFVIKQIHNDYYKNLCDLAESMNCTVKDLASTLLFVAVKDDKFILGHLGDGVIGYLKNNCLKTASLPNNGEFSNETYFSTSKDASSHMKLAKGSVRDIDGFVLMSDGTADSFYNKKEKKLADVLQKIMKLSILIPKNKFDGILANSFHNTVLQATFDDCSIALMSKNTQNFTGFLNVSDSYKREILQINGQRHINLRIKRYVGLLSFMSTQRSSQDIESCAKELGLKKKHLCKYISKLEELSLIEHSEDKYITLVTL